MFETFKRALQSLSLPAGATVIIGVSGGPDSLALLHLFVRARDVLDLRPVAVCVDHGIRAAAQEDARFVEQTAEAWGVAYRIVRVDVPALAAEQRLSVEEAARLARYRALAETARAEGAHFIAVGHSADDQAETVLLNLIRGAGLAGLTGMQPVSSLSAAHVGSELSDRLMLVRPLLAISREEIASYCAEHDLAPRIDESNTDTVYTRNFLRHDLLPRLTVLNPNIRTTLARTAMVLSGEHKIMQAAVDAVWQAIVKMEKKDRVSFDRDRWRDQSIPMQRALVRRAVEHLAGSLSDLGFEAVEAAVGVSRRGDTGAEATLPGGITLRVDYHSVWLAAGDVLPEMPGWPLLAAGTVIPFEQSETIDLENGWQFGLTPYGGPRRGDEWQALLADRWQAVISSEGGRSSVVLRTRQPGDRFYPMGTGGSQLLSDFLIDHRVPAAWRDRLPLVVVGGQIAWVAGWRVDARFAVYPDSKPAWHAFFRRSSE